MDSTQSLLLRGPEVAQALNISRALAYRYMATGVLPTVRVAGGRSIRVPRQALLKWIEENTNEPGESPARKRSMPRRAKRGRR